MRCRLGILLSAVFSLLAAAGSADRARGDGEKTVGMLPGEEWRGVANYFGTQMPFTETTRLEIDITRDSYANQYASLLLSSRGRVIWCDRQAAFGFTNGTITVAAPAPVTRTEAGTCLRDAFRFASKTWFPPSGKTPDELFFLAPQYNTWIEFTYRQNEDGILAYAQSMIDNGLPPGILMINSSWHGHYGDWDFNARNFRDPKGMMAKLRKMGYKVVLWVCPWISLDSPEFRLLYTGIDPFRPGKFPRGGLMLDRTGYPAAVQWWDGKSAMLDFSHPRGREWFKEQLDRLVAEYGVSGFKFDGGALKTYLQDFKASQDMPKGDLANLYMDFALQYPVCEYRHVWKRGGQPLVERLHDKGHKWEDLRKLIPDMIAGGLLGHSFMCPDMVGGGEWHSFLPGAAFEPELFIRSAQVHALCGQMQFSASPWRVLKDERHRQIIRDTVALRQKFAPRFLRLARECGRTGEPMIRHLDYMFPGHGYGRVADQFVMGDFLMVAPQLEKGAATREVEIPPGLWLADDGTEYEGPRKVTVDTPLSRLPHFVSECK